MSLRDLVRETRAPILPKLPEFTRVESEVEKLAKIFESEDKKLTAIAADALVNRFRTALVNGNWNAISFREWKSAVWVSFVGKNPLADNPAFLEHLIEQFRSRQKRSAYQGLILAYLRDFDPQKTSIRRVAAELAGAVRLFDWAWIKRHEKYRLFSPDDAPRLIAAKCLEPGNNALDVLESLGMGGSRSSGGMAAQAWLCATKRVENMLAHRAVNHRIIDTVLEWSAAGDELRYPTRRSAIATALLLPWTNQSVPSDLKEKISAFLIQYLKDPRLPKNAKEWVGVPDDVIAILRRWLTGVALDQFFEVVDQIAQERMWRYRRAFWLAYYKADVVDDAWVLFGPQAQYYARRAFENTQSYGWLEKGYQIQPDQSVLLMKIGKLTIADWSHNGKCHIWLDGNKAAPKLYYPHYNRNDVVQGSDNGGQVHHGSEYGTWQRKVEHFIQGHTGISLSQRNYMPEDWRRK